MLLSARGMSAKMAANGIQAHARINQRRVLESRRRTSLVGAGMGLKLIRSSYFC